LLPPRQRVILILCDVLDWRAREVAHLMNITPAAVNGLLRRARATMNQNYHRDDTAVTVDNKIRALLNRFFEAWESGDVETLVSLLTDKVIFTMPPRPGWYSGREAVRIHAARMLGPRSHDQWRFRQTRANDQDAFACYFRENGDRLFHAHALHVLS